LRLTQLAICADIDSIDSDEEDPKRETEYPRVLGAGPPELEDELCGNEVARDGDGIVEPVVPCEGKAIAGADEASGVGVEGARDGVLGGELAEEDEGDVDDGADEGVGDEHAGGAALGEGAAGAEEEACADGARDGDHLDLPPGEAALETTGGRAEAWGFGHDERETWWTVADTKLLSTS
jgi:hypothetical protein